MLSVKTVPFAAWSLGGVNIPLASSLPCFSWPIDPRLLNKIMLLIHLLFGQLEVKVLNFFSVSVAYEAFLALPTGLSERTDCLFIASRLGCKVITLTQLVFWIFLQQSKPVHLGSP